jgi:hypothetical protein
MSKVVMVGIGAAVLAGGYGIYGMVTDTGPAGWINYVQQNLIGSYSMKMTMLVLMVGVTLIGVAAAWVAEKLGLDQAGGGDSVAAKVATIDDQPKGWRGWLTFGAAAIALTWLIGYAVYWWNVRTDAEDTGAEYERIALADPAQVSAARSTHVALMGEPLAAHYLSHKKRSSSSTPDYHLVPVVAPGWKEGQAVGYVLKTSNLPALGPAFGGMRRFVRPGAPAPAPEPILGRIEGDVPVPAAKALEKAGVPLTKDARLVRFIPSRDGAPDMRDSRQEDFMIFLALCGGISVIWALVTVIAGVAAQRRAARPAQTARAS